MNTQRNRITLILGTLLATASLTPSAHAADGELIGYDDTAVEMADDEQIPARLSSEPREDEPDGTCATCTVDYLVRDSSTGSTVATLGLYFEDNGEDEFTDLQIRVLLNNGSYQTVIVPSVDLFDRHMHTFELQSGSDWTWEDAQYAWVEVL
ncbi:MAG: hypothetical protein KDK70_15690 [Myxococcales bacterium]|nr:hypothetical protein [Myxococcales bacterium]